MKTLSLFASILLLTVSAISCKKSDSNPAATAMKTWKLGTTTYTVNNYAKSSETFQAYDKTGNGIHFSFSAFPTADGVYNVVSNSASLGSGDVSIIAFGSATGSTYFSTGGDNIKATVKVISSSRLQIALPDTWVKNPTTSESLKLSASLGDL